MVIQSIGPDRISELLAAYGSDLSRWPEAERKVMSALSPEERAARLREDQAFDALVASASEEANNAPTPDALMARILAAATNEVAPPSSSADSTAEIMDLPAVVGQRRAALNERNYKHRDWTAAAALLAASLVLGIFVGSTERGQSTAASLGDYAGINISVSPTMTTALDEALQAPDDEDIL